MRADLINRGDTYIDVKENHYLFLTYLIVSRQLYYWHDLFFVVLTSLETTSLCQEDQHDQVNNQNQVLMETSDL